jgi:hypothetical protein
MEFPTQERLPRSRPQGPQLQQALRLEVPMQAINEAG